MTAHLHTVHIEVLISIGKVEIGILLKVGGHLDYALRSQQRAATESVLVCTGDQVGVIIHSFHSKLMQIIIPGSLYVDQ